MDEIEVGDYVRTKKGIARIVEDGRFVEIRENGNRMYYVDTNGTPCTWEFSCYIWSKDIVKHSKNIIDLIEVGDVLKINDEKYEVIYDESYEKLGILVPNRKQLAIRHSALEFIFNQHKDISIVTKEQFANMQYRVKD